jgi:hypothetical protein
MIRRTSLLLLCLSACGPLPYSPPATSTSTSATLWKACTGDGDCTGSEKCGRSKTRELICLQPCDAAGQCSTGLTCNTDLGICLKECEGQGAACNDDLVCLGPNGRWWCF